eukprot:2780409-Lingulodinium_polyedra.AAC.1
MLPFVFLNPPLLLPKQTAFDHPMSGPTPVPDPPPSDPPFSEPPLFGPPFFCTTYLLNHPLSERPAHEPLEL